MKSWFAIFSGNPGLAVEIISSELNDRDNVDSLKLLTRNYLLHFYGTLSMAYHELGNNVKALEYIQKARKAYDGQEKKHGNDKQFMRVYEAANAIYNKDPETAIRILHGAGNGTSVTSQYYLAVAYDSVGDYINAIRYYKLCHIYMYPGFSGLFYNKARQRIEELENDK